ncbi:MAG: hypothetical protein GWP14_00365 [Actinobacteria bacterium]|nr:hypothetical protein [Actinomycetota bacterium]
MKTLLFFDDWYLDKRVNFQRHVCQPELVAESILTEPGKTSGGGYMTAIYDAKENIYKLWFNDFGDIFVQSLVMRYAESEDGYNWQPKSVEGVKDRFVDMVEGLVFSGEHKLSEAMVWRDPLEKDPARRFKMPHVVAERYDPMPVVECRWAYSGDGIHWTVDRERPWLGHISDTANVLLRNPLTGRIQMTMRKRWGDRRVALIQSDDFVHWTQPQTIIHPDPLDPGCVHFYGMPQFYYEGYFIGFLWLMHTVADEIGPAKNAGKVNCQLTYSYDGLNWNRSLREPFVPNRAEGEFGGGCVYPSSLIEAPDGTLRVYSPGTLYEHQGSDKGEKIIDCAALSYRLRKDGFVKLKADLARGRLITKRLKLNDPAMSLNVCAPSGQVSVQISDMEGKPLQGYRFEDCQEFSGDDVEWKPRWRDHKDLSGAMDAEEGVRIEVIADSAELYAIHVDCGLCMNEGPIDNIS